jgi:hypothetical protein
MPHLYHEPHVGSGGNEGSGEPVASAAEDYGRRRSIIDAPLTDPAG